MPVYIKRFFESIKTKENVAKWKAGDNSKQLRLKLIKIYNRYKTGNQFLQPSTVQFLEQEIVPVEISMEDDNYYNLRSRLTRYMLQGKKIKGISNEIKNK